MIYFDNTKNAYGYEIPNPLAVISDELWSKYAGTDKWDIVDGKFIDISETEEYKAEQAQERKAEFEKQFFNIEGVGYYRRQPKGYSSALESVNTAFNAVTIMGKLPANTLTFYKAPDFMIEEQCTEEWLVANSFKNAEMTAQEFGQFYASFITAWNEQEHL